MIDYKLPDTHPSTVIQQQSSWCEPRLMSDSPGCFILEYLEHFNQVSCTQLATFNLVLKGALLLTLLRPFNLLVSCLTRDPSLLTMCTFHLKSSVT